jgi:hypothetical protein
MSEGTTNGTSKSLFWMTSGFVAGLALLLGGAFFMASRVVNAFQMANEGEKSVIRTAQGEFRLERPNQIGPGLPVYPGAILVLPTHVSKLDVAQKSDDGPVAASYHSTDSHSAIDMWYRDHLSKEFHRYDLTQEQLPEIFRSPRISAGNEAFVAARGSELRIVTLAADPTGTKITLGRATGKLKP